MTDVTRADSRPADRPTKEAAVGAIALLDEPRRRARRKGGRRPGPAQLRAGLVEVLGEVGYEPSTDPSGAIRLQNCPYHALASAHRDLTCGMNLAWATGVLEGLEGARLDTELAF